MASSNYHLYLVQEEGRDSGADTASVATWSLCRDSHKKKAIASVRGYQIKSMSLQEKLSLMTRGKSNTQSFVIVTHVIYYDHISIIVSDDGFLADGEKNRDDEESDDEEPAREGHIP